MNFFHLIFQKDKHHHTVDIIADVNALVSGVALYPQLFKIVTTGAVDGFSLLTFSIIAINSIVWLIYATHRRLTPLLVSSFLNFTAALGIIFFIISKN